MLAATGTLNLIQVALEARSDPYRVEEQAARYAPLLAALPPSVTVGYTSDVPLEDARGQVLLFALRYALAPRVVTSKPDQELVVGNLVETADAVAYGAARGLEVERDLGQGLVIYRRRGGK